MSHHIAELIETAAATRGRARQEAEDRCRRAILELWAYRRELEGQRPAEALEPLLAALDMLEPLHDTPYHYRRFWRARDEDAAEKEDPEVAKWIAIAQGADRLARGLIGWALGRAASHTLDISAAWVDLARHAGAPEDLPLVILRRARVGDPAHIAEDDDPVAPLRKKLEQLAAFRALADSFEEELRDALERAERESSGDGPAGDAEGSG
ncbi:hypothetical protein [Rhizorhabdus wittichii]|uniref:hypothetical protein n=1 Tax=Rhizorhabdus wittichii TaxID=160791 RepID=UPI0002DEAE3F|nr:hypothetical protein [Rhizorhabdus wittichii]